MMRTRTWVVGLGVALLVTSVAMAGPDDKDFASEIRRLSALWK